MKDRENEEEVQEEEAEDPAAASSSSCEQQQLRAAAATQNQQHAHNKLFKPRLPRATRLLVEVTKAPKSQRGFQEPPRAPDGSHDPSGSKHGSTLVSYNAGISACEKGEQWHRALALLSEMREAKLEPNVISYNAGISVCEKGEQWQ